MVEYQEAREYPDLRQRFLDEIDLGEYGAYVKGVKYFSRQTPIGDRMVKNSTFMQTALPLPANPLKIFFRGNRSLVMVADLAFDHFENPHDFSGVLLHHEGDHARECFRGRPISFLFSNQRLEELAYLNQLRNLDPNCSKEYIEAILSKLSMETSFLDISSTS